MPPAFGLPLTKTIIIFQMKHLTAASADFLFFLFDSNCLNSDLSEMCGQSAVFRVISGREQGPAAQSQFHLTFKSNVITVTGLDNTQTH